MKQYNNSEIMLSIIIINFKNPPLLRLCLKSLFNVVPSDLKTEIIVVDIASSVETRNIIDEFDDVRRLPFKENIGYTRGVNEGVKAALGEVLFIINPDIIPLESSIKSMYEYIADNLSIGLLGPQLLNFDRSIQDSCFGFYGPLTIVYRRTFMRHMPWAKKEVRRFLMQDTDKTNTINVDWLMGSALMTTKKAVSDVGYMDKEFFLYMSEVDWAKRFWENGYKVVYFPKAKMYHYHRRGSKGKFDALDIINKETRWHIIDALKYFKKHGILRKSFST